MNESIELRTVVDATLRELRRHGSEDFPIGIYRDDFSEFEHGRLHGTGMTRSSLTMW